jgi:hypothetical protein
MNPRYMTMVALLLPTLALAGDPAPAKQPDPKPAAIDAAPKAKLDLAVRREIALDDQVMRNLDRAATREKDLSPRKLFREPGADAPIESRFAINLRPGPTAGPFPDRATTRCNLNVCRVYDDRGRALYSYQTARIGIDVPATRELWESCQARQNDMLSTFERGDRCHGFHSQAPSLWDPAPRAWP